MIVKQDEFDGYLGNLVQKSKKSACFGSPYDKALFQGAMMGLLSCEEKAFTGRQVAKIIETVLNYEKAPGNEGSTGLKQKILQDDYTS